VLIVGTEKGAAVIVDLNRGRAHTALVKKAGRGKDGVVVQGVKTMREGIQVRMVIKNMTRVVLDMKGIKGEMIETEGGIEIWKVKLGEPELENGRTGLAIVIGTGILHAQNIARLMFAKTGQGLGIKVEMQTVEASDLEK
jgi:hypothetical protein